MFAFLYCLHTKSSRRKYIFAHHSLGSNAAVVQICLLSRDRCSLSIYSYCLMSKREIYPWILKFCYSSWQQSEDVFGCWCPLTPFLFSRVLWRGWPLLSLGGSSLLLGFLQLCVTEVLSDPSCGPGGGGGFSCKWQYGMKYWFVLCKQNSKLLLCIFSAFLAAASANSSNNSYFDINYFVLLLALPLLGHYSVLTWSIINCNSRDLTTISYSICNNLCKTSFTWKHHQNQNVSFSLIISCAQISMLLPLT